MKQRMVGIGPVVVEQYPQSAYSKMPPEVRLEDAWRLCGPTVDMNMDKHPLWKVFCIVYLEGLMHGAATMENILCREQKSKPDSVTGD